MPPNSIETFPRKRRIEVGHRVARVLVRVERLIGGNPGEHRNLTDGVSELKIDFGPGYRVYYSQRGTRLLLLLAGGDKSSQSKDVQLAINLASSFKE